MIYYCCLHLNNHDYQCLNIFIDIISMNYLLIFSVFVLLVIFIYRFKVLFILQTLALLYICLFLKFWGGILTLFMENVMFTYFIL